MYPPLMLTCLLFFRHSFPQTTLQVGDGTLSFQAPLESSDHWTQRPRYGMECHYRWPP